MKQIGLETHHHSTRIEVVKTPKKLFFMVLAIWLLLSVAMVIVLGMHWIVLCYGGLSAAIGIGWVTAYPEYHMRRIKD